MVKENYEIFISYRRDGGDFLGKMLYDRFIQAGYAPFFDVESLRAGEFNKQLYDVIENCTDFILILPPKGLNRCLTDSDDWVMQEINCAIKNEKNIIPIMMRGFEWPENLPSSIEKLPMYEAITADTEYFDAMFNKLRSKFLKSNSKNLVQSATSRFPVTCSSLFTPTVDTVLDFAMTNHRINAVKEFFFKLEKTYKADCKWGKEELEKVYESVLEWNKDERNWDRWWDGYSTVHSPGKGDLFALKEWIYNCSKTQQDELQRFFIEVKYMGELFDIFGNLNHTMKLYPQFEYRNEQWQMMDVFELGKEKYGVGIRRTKALLPEIQFFTIYENDKLMQISDTNPILMLCLLEYSMGCRLIDWLPYIVFKELHAKDFEELKKALKITGNDVDYILKRQLQMYQLLKPISVRGNVKIKQLLGTKIYTLQFGIDRTEEYRELPLLGYPLSNIYDLNSLYTLDIVKGRRYISGNSDETEYYVLCCGKNPKDFFIDLPQIFIIKEKINIKESFSVELEVHKVRSAKELFPEVQERFALRMMSARGMGLISNNE